MNIRGLLIWFAIGLMVLPVHFAYMFNFSGIDLRRMIGSIPAGDNI